MKMKLKHENKQGNKIIEITEPIASPFQILKDKLKLNLVYVPKRCYYWLIDDIANNRKDYKNITVNTEPERLEDSENVKNSSIYQILRISIINHLNELEIRDLKYDNELDSDTSLTEDIFYKHIGYIADVLYGEKENRINDLENEIGIFKQVIEDSREFIQNEDREELIKDLKFNYLKRQNIGKSNLSLSFIITDYLKIKKQYLTHFLYQLDENSKGYDLINFDSLHEQINELIGKNLIKERDLETALSHTVANLTPVYNMIKFKNGILDYNNLRLIENEDPIFTIVNIDYNYSKNKYPNITDFLNTSLNQGDEKATNKYILGVKELIGYLFCSGNQDEIMIFIVGIAGSGKSTLTNLITTIFHQSKISDMKLQDPDKNPHATAGLLGKHLNIARDSDTKPVENIGLLKQIRGYDPLDVNPKGRDIITIPKEEVPKFLLVSNQMPIFRNIDDAFQETAIFIEFKHKFRGTNKEKTYVKGFEALEIEGFVYDCLEANNDRRINNRDFILQKDLETNKFKFEMHSKPLHYLINELVRYDSNIPDSDDEDKIYVDEFNQMIIKLAKYKGLTIKLNSMGQIDGRIIMKAIKDNFDLHDWKDQNDRNYVTVNDSTNHNKRYYPDLVKKTDVWDTLNYEK